MAYRETPRTRAKKAATRRRILDACYHLVGRGGFNAISVSRVAQSAHIATGSIYRHFPSKADLIAEVFRYCTEHEVEAVSAAATGSTLPPENLHAAVQTFCLRAIGNRRLAWALIAEPVAPMVEKARLDYRYAYTEIFQNLISEGVERGHFVDQNPALTASAVVGVLGEVLVRPLGSTSYEKEVGGRGSTGPEQADLLVREITRLIERLVGVRPDAGRPETGFSELTESV